MSDDGHFRAYAPRKFTADRMETIVAINAIIDDYAAQGYTLTVRQIYYQLVGSGQIANSGRAYDQVQSAVNDGRMAGLISWTAVEDRGRNLRGLRTYDSPAAAVRAARAGYRRDLWAHQRVRPEVWVEKQALEGVVERICSQLRVDFYATRGYDSQSQSWRAGRRFADRMRKGQQTVVIHLGDHDPSGIDMTRDNHERLSLFAGHKIAVQRIALNMNQIVQHALPENPENRPKPGDARSRDYIEKYGNMGWELDALRPQVMSDLIEQAVAALRDEELWSSALAEEVSDRRELDAAIEAMGGDPASEDDEGEED